MRANIYYYILYELDEKIPLSKGNFLTPKRKKKLLKNLKFS